MEETAKHYYPLGSKTLFMMISKKGMVMILLLPTLIAGIYFLQYVPEDYVDVSMGVLYLYGGLLLCMFVGMCFISWIEYMRYSISIDEKSLRIQKGFISVEEMGLPYRRIKNIRIKRNLIDQIFGVSNIIITVLDADTKKAEEESTIYLPCLDKHLAEQIQDSILKSAQVEQVHVSDVRSPV